MGYTHHFAYLPHSLQLRRAWPLLRLDTARILSEARRSGVFVAGVLGDEEPLLDEQVIAFNGRGNQQRDMFVLSRTALTNRSRWGRRYMLAACETGRRPYDLAVAAVLLRTWQLAPKAISLGSDGTWDEDWRAARELVADLFPDKRSSRRQADRSILINVDDGPASIRPYAPWVP